MHLFFNGPKSGEFAISNGFYQFTFFPLEESSAIFLPTSEERVEIFISNSKIGSLGLEFGVPLGRKRQKDHFRDDFV